MRDGLTIVWPGMVLALITILLVAPAYPAQPQPGQQRQQGRGQQQAVPGQRSGAASGNVPSVCGTPSPGEPAKAGSIAPDLSLIENSGSSIRGRIQRLRSSLSVDETAPLRIWTAVGKSGLDDMEFQFYSSVSVPDRSCPDGIRWVNIESPKNPTKAKDHPVAGVVFSSFALVLVPRVEQKEKYYRFIPATLVSASVFNSDLERTRNILERSPARSKLLAYFTNSNTPPGVPGEDRTQCQTYKNCFRTEEVLGAWHGSEKDEIGSYFKKCKDFWAELCSRWKGATCPDWGL